MCSSGRSRRRHHHECRTHARHNEASDTNDEATDSADDRRKIGGRSDCNNRPYGKNRWKGRQRSTPITYLADGLRNRGRRGDCGPEPKVRRSFRVCRPPYCVTISQSVEYSAGSQTHFSMMARPAQNDPRTPLARAGPGVSGPPESIPIVRRPRLLNCVSRQTIYGRMKPTESFNCGEPDTVS